MIRLLRLVMLALEVPVALMFLALFGCAHKDDSAQNEADADADTDADTDTDTDTDADIDINCASWVTGQRWAFGECAGACKGDLTVSDTGGIVYTLSNWNGKVYVENTGQMTATAMTKLCSYADGLVDTQLDDVYGCPECSDGGSETIELIRNDIASQHKYEYGFPPTELAPIDVMLDAIRASATTCTDKALVVLDKSCTPYEANP